MLALADSVPYAKQPLLERTTGTIVGYTGVDSILLDGTDRLEWGWHLARPSTKARGAQWADGNALDGPTRRGCSGEG